MRGPGLPEATVARKAVFSEPRPSSTLKPASRSTAHCQACALTSSKASSTSACIFVLMPNSDADAASIALHAESLVREISVTHGSLASVWRFRSAARTIHREKTCVFDEFRNRPGAPRMTRHAHVQADRHHLGMGRAFLIEPVEGVAQMLLEILGLTEMSLRESRVVVDQRVGDHEMLLVADHRPVGQIVVVGIGVVDEPALLDHQLTRVHAGSIATVPAERPLACR